MNRSRQKDGSHHNCTIPFLNNGKWFVCHQFGIRLKLSMWSFVCSWQKSLACYQFRLFYFILFIWKHQFRLFKLFGFCFYNKNILHCHQNLITRFTNIEMPFGHHQGFWAFQLYTKLYFSVHFHKWLNYFSKYNQII